MLNIRAYDEKSVSTVILLAMGHVISLSYRETDKFCAPVYSAFGPAPEPFKDRHAKAQFSKIYTCSRK